MNVVSASGTAELEQREQRLPRVQPGHAEDRVFGLAGQLREHVDRADQHRDRQHLIDARRRLQHHVEKRHQRCVVALTLSSSLSMSKNTNSASTANRMNAKTP
jgi:hypothetical protein